MTTRIDKKETRTHNKNTTQAETQKKKELEQRRQRIQRMQAQETSRTERRLCAKHQTQKNKYEATKNPLLPQKIVQEHETKTCSVDERNPPKKKETMIL